MKLSDEIQKRDDMCLDGQGDLAGWIKKAREMEADIAGWEEGQREEEGYHCH